MRPEPEVFREILKRVDSLRPDIVHSQAEMHLNESELKQLNDILYEETRI